jgi:hypothetical protein
LYQNGDATAHGIAGQITGMPRKNTILVVDDEETDRTSIVEALRAQKYLVV